MKKRILILLVFACYLLALNPYLGPATYDDVVYFLGAESLAKGEGYLYQGKLIGDWPPLFSTLLSLPMRFGFSSVWTAKLVVLTAILISFLPSINYWRERIAKKKAYPFCSLLSLPLDLSSARG